MDVWLLEAGEYEQRFIWAVVSSPDLAAAFLRTTFGEPYRVKWDQPVRVDDDEWSITGHFTAVPGHCVDGPQTYSLQRHKLDGHLMGSDVRVVPS